MVDITRIPPASHPVIVKDSQIIDQYWYDYLSDLAADVRRLTASSRARLLATTSYWVRNDGNDLNDGSANDASHAFLTIQGAINKLIATVDARGQQVFINLASGGTYAGFSLFSSLTGQNASSGFTIGGDSTCTVTSASSNTITIAHSGTKCNLTGFKVTNTGAGNGIRVADNAYAELNGVLYGACGNSQIVSAVGAHIYLNGNYTISGNAANHYEVSGTAVMEFFSNTVAMTGTPAFSNAFAYVYDNGAIQTGGMTYGATTGKRYITKNGGGVNTLGGGPNYFPGNVAGTADAATFAWYA